MANRKSSVVVSGGVTFLELLFVVFLVLKLIGVIDWSWWWVTAPLWGVFGLLLGILIIGLLFIAVATGIKMIRDK